MHSICNRRYPGSARKRCNDSLPYVIALLPGQPRAGQLASPPMEDLWMSTPRHTRDQVFITPLRPTAYLLHPDPDELNPAQVSHQVAHGFAFTDVQNLLSATTQCGEQQVWRRILGQPQSRQRSRRRQRPARLTPQQSAIALHYACAVELASEVFGSLALAEAWLVRPCFHFGGELPLDMLSNAVGFQALKVYLQQLAYGVYA